MSNGLSRTDSSFLASSGLTTNMHWLYYCTIHVYVVILIDANLCRLLILVWIVDHHCLEVFVRFADIGGIIDHHCSEIIVHFVDIGVNCWPSLFRDHCSLCWYWWNYWPSLFRDHCSLCWYWCELLTITV